MPTAWPIPRFEQSNALYALLVADVLDHPQLRDLIDTPDRRPEPSFRKTGLGFSDVFDPDGDDTAVALAVVNAAGKDIGTRCTRIFQR